MSHKIRNWYAVIMTSLFIIFSSLFIYWSFIDGVFVHKVTNQDFITYKTDKEVYYPGDSVFVSVKGLCKNRDIKAHTYLNLVDGILLPFNVKDRAIPKGCIDENKYYFFETIPFINLPDGEYYFSGFHQYDINPFRQGASGIKVNFETNKFEINSHKIWID